MTELSFSAVILTGKSPAGRGNEGKVAGPRAVEIFCDMGVEDISILGPLESRDAWQSHPFFAAETGKDPWTSLGAVARIAKGTHLLVLDSLFQRMDPVFFVRLMQMSCLGMGVLPFVHGIPNPLVACYPVSICTLGAFVSNAAAPESLAGEALEKGLVARYDVSPQDMIFFEKNRGDIEPLHFSSR